MSQQTNAEVFDSSGNKGMFSLLQCVRKFFSLNYFNLQKNSYSFLNTQYGTTYTVSFRKPGKGSNQTASVYRTFTTPHCIVFQKKYSKIKCQQHRHHVAAGVVIQDTNNKLMDNWLDKRGTNVNYIKIIPPAILRDVHHSIKKKNPYCDYNLFAISIQLY